MKQFSVLIALLLWLVPAMAYADPLSDAKQKGLVGERPDGYLAAVSLSAAPEIQQLVNTINQQRKAEYTRIAQKNSQSLVVVEKLAADKVRERAQPGEYFMDASGKWVKK